MKTKKKEIGVVQFLLPIPEVDEESGEPVIPIKYLFNPEYKYKIDRIEDENIIISSKGKEYYFNKEEYEGVVFKILPF